jgi:hypothetical protein
MLASTEATTAHPQTRLIQANSAYPEYDEPRRPVPRATGYKPHATGHVPQAALRPLGHPHLA